VFIAKPAVPAAFAAAVDAAPRVCDWRRSADDARGRARGIRGSDERRRLYIGLYSAATARRIRVARAKEPNMYKVEVCDAETHEILAVLPFEVDTRTNRPTREQVRDLALAQVRDRLPERKDRDLTGRVLYVRTH
jgi:hypothetical protein